MSNFSTVSKACVVSYTTISKSRVHIGNISSVELNSMKLSKPHSWNCVLKRNNQPIWERFLAKILACFLSSILKIYATILAWYRIFYLFIYSTMRGLYHTSRPVWISPAVLDRSWLCCRAKKLGHLSLAREALWLAESDKPALLYSGPMRRLNCLPFPRQL